MCVVFLAQSQKLAFHQQRYVTCKTLKGTTVTDKFRCLAVEIYDILLRIQFFYPFPNLLNCNGRQSWETTKEEEENFHSGEIIQSCMSLALYQAPCTAKCRYSCNSNMFKFLHLETICTNIYNLYEHFVFCIHAG